MNTKIWFGLPLILFLLTGSAFIIGGTLSQKSAGMSYTDELSYGMGLRIGMLLEAQGLYINPDIFLRGLKDGSHPPTSLLAKKQICKTIGQLQINMTSKCSESQAEILEKNTTKGYALFHALLMENGKILPPPSLPYGLEY